MRCLRRLVKIIWTDLSRNEVVLHSVKSISMLHTINRRNTNWIGHILRRNCFWIHVIEEKMGGRIEVTERREIRSSSYWMTLRKRRYAGNWKKEVLHSVGNSLWKRLRSCRKTDCTLTLKEIDTKKECWRKRGWGFEVGKDRVQGKVVVNMVIENSVSIKGWKFLENRRVYWLLRNPDVWRYLHR
jgi:hypothetical protein